MNILNVEIPDGPRTMAFLKVLKDAAYDVFAGYFHPGDWDRVSERYDEALAEVLSSDDLLIIEYALRLAIGDAHATACRIRSLKESEAEIARRDADYERVLAVYRRFTGISVLMEADHVQSNSSSTEG